MSQSIARVIMAAMQAGRGAQFRGCGGLLSTSDLPRRWPLGLACTQGPHTRSQGMPRLGRQDRNPGSFSILASYTTADSNSSTTQGKRQSTCPPEAERSRQVRVSVLDAMCTLPKVSPTSELPVLICQKLKDYLGFSDEDLADAAGRFQEFDPIELDPEVWTSAEAILLARARESVGDAAEQAHSEPGVVRRKGIGPFRPEGVLGTGSTGEVIAGWFQNLPVAAKFAPFGTREMDELVREVHVYPEVQGPHTPRLIWHGPVPGGDYMLLITRVFGRHLRAGGADAEYLPQALAALRAVHAAGYLHGDVSNPSHWLLEQAPYAMDTPPAGSSAVPTPQGRQMKSPENPRVFILDFGLTRKREAMSLFQELEEAELHDFLLGRAWSDHAYGPW